MSGQASPGPLADLRVVDLATVIHHITQPGL